LIQSREIPLPVPHQVKHPLMVFARPWFRSAPTSTAPTPWRVKYVHCRMPPGLGPTPHYSSSHSTRSRVTRCRPGYSFTWHPTGC